MTSPKDAEKIQSVRGLLSVAQENTKKGMQGKAGNAQKEAKAVKNVLQFVLGREPNQDEVDLAQAV